MNSSCKSVFENFRWFRPAPVNTNIKIPTQSSGIVYFSLAHKQLTLILQSIEKFNSVYEFLMTGGQS